MKIVERLLGVEKRAQTFVLSTNAIEMRILFLTDDIVRIRAGFTGDFAEESYSLVMTLAQSETFPTRDCSRFCLTCMTGKKLKLHISRRLLAYGC